MSRTVGRLAHRSFKTTISGSPVIQRSGRKGAISPARGVARDSAGREVSRGGQAEVLLPDLVGLDTEAARRLLRTARLRPGVVRVEWSREFETRVVTGQDSPAGRWVPEETRVDLTIPSGPGADTGSMTRPQGDPPSRRTNTLRR